MSLRKVLLAITVICLAAACFPASQQHLLPANVAGWKLVSSSQGKNAASADPANAALLREYGFTESESATYVRAGKKLHVKAASFKDGTGAYGAFTFFVEPGMQKQEIGDQAMSEGEHVLFLRANVLVDAYFDHPTSMSAAELRELAQELPVVQGGAATGPGVPAYLPEQEMIPGSLRYVVGPVGLAAIGVPLPAQLVDFNQSPEIATAQYRTRWGSATLAIVEYPTPQIAVDHLAAVATSLGQPANSAQKQATLTLNSNDGELTLRRTGPMLVLVKGAITTAEAQALVQSVNYDAQVTWSQPPPVTSQKIGALIVGIFVLIALLIAIFLVVMIFFGGAFVVLQKIFPNYRFLPSQKETMIKLNLKN
jgi:hypothetical protein